MLNDAGLVVAANAVDAAITHMQLHTGARGAGATANVSSAPRVAVNGTVDADGDITWVDTAFTGGEANGPVAEVSYWTASSGGTNLGGAAVTGDTTFNSAGEFLLESITESTTAT